LTNTIYDRKRLQNYPSRTEYVAPEKIENIISASALIGQCFVYGDSYQNCLVAIVVPDEEPVRHWAKTNGSSSVAAASSNASTSSFRELCQSPDLKAAILSDIQSLSHQHGLHGFETVKDVYLESELFTTENDLVTPTFKLKRNKLRDAYQTEIDAMYDRMSAAPTSKL
jgi:long-chain acyl-CoA synthetase